MAPALREKTSIRVALAIDAKEAAKEAANALARRGIAAEAVTVDQLVDVSSAVIGYAPAKPPGRAEAAELARICEAAAHAGRPLVMLAAYAPPSPKQLRDRILSLAYLRASGAIICRDPDVWLETIVLIAAHGLPDGGQVAVVTPPDSWLSASANALSREWLGSQLPTMSGSLDQTGSVDVALVDSAELSASSPSRLGEAMVVPLMGRVEQLNRDAPVRKRNRVPLVGLRNALLATATAGRLAARIASGLGRASEEDAEFDIDAERFERQLDKLGERAGDHETKVLLAAYEVKINRQAVATTPSAATRIAKKAGYPVEVKPWGPDIASETDGCPVESGLTTAADVRRAYAAVAKRANLAPGTPVIVRETPPRGREASVDLRRWGPLGWMLILDVSGSNEPVAAPAPMTVGTAMEMARLVEATRSGDAPPDRAALADILVRVSHLANDYASELDSLHLHRVIIGDQGSGAMVVDASANLARKTYENA